MVADPSTSIDSGEVWGVADEWGDNGTGASPGVIRFTVGRVGDMDGVEEGMRGVVGNETTWGNGILVLGHLIVDLRHGVFAILRHGFGPDG